MPTPATPPTTHAAALEIRVFWGSDALLRADHLPSGRGFVVGTGSDADFGLAEDEAGPWRWALVTPGANGPRIRLPEGARFHLIRGEAGAPLEGACDRPTDLELGATDCLRVEHRGFTFLLSRSADVVPPHRPRARIGAGLAMTMLAAGLVVSTSFAMRPPARPEIVAETTIDLSNPAVMALIAQRRATPPTSRTEPRTVAPTFAPPVQAAPPTQTAPSQASPPESAPVAPTDATPRVEPETSPGAAPTNPSAVPSVRPASTPRSATTESPAEATPPDVDFESDVVVADAPPSQLGAIRSHVRSLTRCFDERVAAERDPSARAALEECLARTPTVRPDAIVSYDIEVRDSRGNVERAGGGRFGIAVTP